MIKIRLADDNDEKLWKTLDAKLSSDVLRKKMADKQCYLAFENDRAIGCLRYGLFWDDIPFCNLLLVETAYRGHGYGTELMRRWETDMKNSGYDHVMLSTQADERAQHFYRKLGYKDCGALFLRSPPLSQPAELFFIKKL